MLSYKSSFKFRTISQNTILFRFVSFRLAKYHINLAVKTLKIFNLKLLQSKLPSLIKSKVPLTGTFPSRAFVNHLYIALSKASKPAPFSFIVFGLFPFSKAAEIFSLPLSFIFLLQRFGGYLTFKRLLFGHFQAVILNLIESELQDVVLQFKQ